MIECASAKVFFSRRARPSPHKKRIIENEIKINVCILMCMCQYFIQIFGYFFLFLACQGKKKIYIYSFVHSLICSWIVEMVCCVRCVRPNE